ncbi:hypothetical protein [Streptomyces decoyicus]|uniref:hypothetical protein n=1 Tax=Streptomyces decoyicus TaxID=249567 RepID=UPI0033B3B763
MAIEHIMYAYADGRIAVAVEDSPAYGGQLDLWPSVGEYPFYDPFLHYAMSHDSVRNDAFRRALLAVAGGRTVLDIGTGQNLHWALEVGRHGARSVVAVEAMEKGYQVAAEKLAGTPEAVRSTCGTASRST